MIKTAQFAPADYRHLPERPLLERKWLERMQGRLQGQFELAPWRLKVRARRFVNKVAKFAVSCEGMNESQLLSRSVT